MKIKEFGVFNEQATARPLNLAHFMNNSVTIISIVNILGAIVL